jgi:hypothetical protein
MEREQEKQAASRHLEPNYYKAKKKLSNQLQQNSQSLQQKIIRCNESSSVATGEG